MIIIFLKSNFLNIFNFKFKKSKHFANWIIFLRSGCENKLSMKRFLQYFMITMIHFWSLVSCFMPHSPLVNF